ncbi:HAD family phosphatase [Planosporangium thailandense]|uniref:HAD family phosphatase n=1 Tax=Planosporangium thailandense TaxID=765197 RepID=A0ABX0XZQ9_9ACTN|nr:HAD family phosphatase [Planosporangium thailandense]
MVFDCDGTLVDSERIGVQVGRRMLADLGVTLTEAEFVERFVGCSKQHWTDEVARVVGGPPPADWSRRHDELFAVALEQLRPVPGAVEVLDALDGLGVPYRLASNSDRAHIARTLELTGLADRFTGRVHSAHDVARGKPAPDVYLAAAAAAGVDPGECWVVEDSPFGVEAGVAAGMRTFAFTGGVHPRARLARPGVPALDELVDLVPLLERHLLSTRSTPGNCYPTVP